MVIAREIMRAGSTYVTPADSAVAAAQVMRDSALPQIPVCQGGRLVGVVSQSDIMDRCVATGRDPGRTCTGELMRTAEAVVDAGASLETALVVMAEHRVRGLPVLDGDIYVGLLAQVDATRSLLPDAFRGLGS